MARLQTTPPVVRSHGAPAAQIVRMSEAEIATSDTAPEPCFDITILSHQLTQGLSAVDSNLKAHSVCNH